MPLNPADPSYIAEITPASIAAMERPLCSAYGVSLDAFGAKGNTVHLSGYHRSRQWILNSRDSARGSSDYSVQDSRDRSGDQRWVSAFDFTPGSWGTPDNRSKMIAITKRVRAAARARDPRLANLREFAGTEDGRTVVTFNCADGSLKSPFDSSHLDHCHGSFWRSRANNDHTGIVDIILGRDDDMAFMDDTDAAELAWRADALFADLPATRGGKYLNKPEGVNKLHAHLAAIDAKLAAGGVDPAAVAALVVEQLGPLLPTLADIERIVAEKVKEALNGTKLQA